MKKPAGAMKNIRKLAEAEKNKSKVLEAKFQELFKKAKEEPITKPIKDIDLD